MPDDLITLTDEHAARLWANIVRSNDPDTCWLWAGPVNGTGYGSMTICGRSVGVHRVSWMLANGPIPPEMCVCHTCDHPRCVRPDHLFLGTRRDNSRDMAQKRRHRHHRHPEARPRGERNPAARLTWEKVREIRARYAAGEVPERFYREYGIGKSTVWRIIRGTNWRE